MDSSREGNAVTASGSAGDELLARLESLLTRQVQAAGQRDYDSVLNLGQGVDELLERIGSSPPPVLPGWTDTLARIKQLHHQLGLMLTLDRQETAAQLEQCRRGKGALGSYGPNG